MGRRIEWLVGVAATFALAGCSASSDAPSPSESASASSQAATMSIGNAASSSAMIPTPSVAEPPSVQPTTQSSWSVAPLPADLTPQQVIDADAALEVYRQYWALFDTSGAEPSRDWSAQVAQVATGSAADGFVQGTSSLAKDGLHAVGTTSVEARVTKVEPAVVNVTSCVDTSSTDLLDESGTSVLAPDQPGSYFRYVSTAQIGRFDGRWKLTVEQGNRKLSC